MVLSTAMPGVSIEITVGNNTLKEYEDQDQEEQLRTTARYVEAVTGETFVISIQLNPEFRFKGSCVSFEIFVDGNWVHSPVIGRYSTPSCKSEGARMTARTMRKYQFASLETAADGQIRRGEEGRHRDLGTIVVKCAHKMQGAESEGICIGDVENVGIISEKALKGGSTSHSVDFAAPTACIRPTIVNTYSVAGEPDPGATIIFKYRSIAALRSMLVIPDTTPAAPAPVYERDAREMTEDDIRELQRQLREERGMNEGRRLREAQEREAAAIRMREEAATVKREQAENNTRRRRVFMPAQGDTVLDLDDDGAYRESSEPLPPRMPPVVIEID